MFSETMPWKGEDVCVRQALYKRGKEMESSQISIFKRSIKCLILISLLYHLVTGLPP